MTRGVARSARDVELVRYLAGFGCGATEISRITGLPHTTVWNWLAGRGAPAAEKKPACWRCEPALPVPAEAYVYLLGLYLGDGHIASARRNVKRLSIYQDAPYVDLIAEAAQTMATVLPSRVGMRTRNGCVAINSYSKHWPCLFPQHGPGRKHERAIALQAWQQQLVDAHPRELLRGLIHSDGSRHVNRVVTRGKPYEYARYNFSNASADIRRIFTDTCDALGVHWTQMNERNVAVSRRADVEFLDTFIGPKS